MSSLPPDYSQEYDPNVKAMRTYFKDAHGVRHEVRSVEEHQRQRAPDSHLRAMDTAKAKQSLRRHTNVTDRVNQLVYDRADVNYHPDVKQVSDDTYINTLRHDPAFQPLASYRSKLVTRGGKQVRPILKGEVGIIGSRIFVLQEGYGRPVVGGLDTTTPDKE